MIKEFRNQQHHIDYVNSEIEDIPGKIKEIFNIENATVILKKRDKIVLGAYEDGIIKFNENTDITAKEMFLELRVFNKDREIYFWNTSKGIKGRYITDNGAIIADIFEEKLMLWGKVSKINKDYMVLSEEKIKDLVIPKVRDVLLNDIIYLKINNYIFKNEDDGVPYIKYWRAVEITK